MKVYCQKKTFFKKTFLLKNAFYLGQTDLQQFIYEVDKISTNIYQIEFIRITEKLWTV